MPTLLTPMPANLLWHGIGRSRPPIGPAPPTSSATLAAPVSSKDGRVVFNIAGNKYRIVVWINYPYRVVYVRFIDSHRMYDATDAQTI